MQYTLRNIPAELDRAIKNRAQVLGKSINQVTLDALAQGFGQSIRHRNLHDMPGAWSKEEAAAFEVFLGSLRTIDEELWK
jgi:hypothetical protein